TMVESTDADLVVAEEGMFPAQRGFHRVADLTAGRGGDLFVRVEAGHELIAGPRLRARIRTHLGRLGEGIAEVAVPAIGHRLAQREGRGVGITLVGIAQYRGLVAERPVAV